MPRNKKRKTDRGVFSADVMKTAVKEVLEQKRAVRTVAKEFGLSRATLSRYVDDTRKRRGKYQLQENPCNKAGEFS